MDDVGIVCQRLDCESSDVSCVLNKTKSIQWQFVGIPTVPLVPNPLVSSTPSERESESDIAS